jgi:hypothetical protein
MTAWQMTGTDKQWPMTSIYEIKFPLYCRISFNVFLSDFSEFLDSFSLLSFQNVVTAIAHVIQLSTIWFAMSQ